MARKNPLGTIKDVAVGTAKGGVELGMSVAGQVASKATDTVTSLIPGRKPAAPAKGTPPDLEPAEPAAASRKSQGDPMAPAKTAAPKTAAPEKAAPEKAAPEVPDISPDKPVNVTKELGLDAAPVAKTQAAKDQSLTKIDAGADASDVDVTPADIAPAVKKAPAKKTPAKKAPAKKAAAKKAPAKKAPAKKTASSTPGDKLPPRTT
ncbi:MAG: hypothetical protein Q8O61_02610 [Nocardioides sp.]|nr:hypothetical protein [Nocardioides sp.]